VVNRLRAVKVIKKVAVRTLAVDKASRADSRVANKVELKRAVSKAAANSIGETK
jgi:hypothetical protein